METATSTNQDIIKKFFEAYQKHDMNALRQVMEENVIWTFEGQHPLAGIKNGLNQVVEFFDQMGAIMKESNSEMEKLIEAENEKYFIECQHSITHRNDGNQLDHYTAVLWEIKNGKIISGRHFFADPKAADKYFNAVANSK